MENLLPDLPYNLVILTGFIATGTLYAAAADTKWIFGVFKNRPSGDTAIAARKTCPRNRLAARIIVGICSATTICATLIWLANYDLY